MPVPFSRSPRRWLAIASLLGISACKASAPAGAQAPVVEDDIAAIEAELARNRSELESAGIMVASAADVAQPGAVGATPDTTPDAELDDSDDAATIEPAEDPGSTPLDEEASPEPPPAPAAGPPADQTTSERTFRQRAERRRFAAKDKKTKSRCERICELADATCDLAQQVCSLAQRHQDEPRYVAACSRAEDQCRAASIACTRCE